MLVTATRLEDAAVRKGAPRMQVLRVGMAVRTAPPARLPLALSVGLAGGLAPELPPGTVVVPDSVSDEAGSTVACDPEWTAALRQAARDLGHPAVAGRCLTSAELVTGARRATLAAQGFVAVDLESALLAQHADRLAVCRVVLDTASHELDPRWSRPGGAALDPRLWKQGAWLARWAPRYSRLSARVAAHAWRLLRATRSPSRR